MKYIQEVEDHNNIRTFVVSDLKRLGIKPPKSKKNKTREDNVIPTNQAVFNNHLNLVPSLIIDGCGPVPRFLVEATDYLRNHLHTEGLFRKSGSVARQKELKDKVELGNRFDDAHPFDVASLIKQFFRELPDSLLTSRLHDTYLKCHGLDKEEERQEAIFLLCLLLPWHHLSTLRFFMQFLACVADHSNKNKMDVSNLALCLAPNILHMNVKAEKMKDSETKLLQVQTSIVRLLIEQADDIGMLGETLFEKASLMGSLCFPSDDELEKSCDELDDSQPVKGKKKKKKKRSGSLQGLVSNLSSSFSKWRRDNRMHNSSSVSDKSSMISTVSTDMPDASCMSEMSPECHVTLPADYQTPKVMRKRKASAEMLPFSATKKKAILQQMPQMSTLGTPYTPATRSRLGPGHEFALGTPSIKFMDGSSQLVFTATPGEGPVGSTPRRKVDHILSPSSAMKVKRHATGKTGCFSPKTPKSGKRRSVKGFFRRLSGSKESPGGLDSSDVVGKRLANASSSGIPLSNKKKGGFFRRHRKTPSSPARLVTNILPKQASTVGDGPYHDDSISLISSTTSLSSQESITSLELAGRLDRDLQQSHRRRFSAEGSPMSAALRRGKPNTITSGLPDPSKRRSFEQGPADSSTSVPSGPIRHSSQREIFISPKRHDHLDCSPVAFNTSPIPKAELQMLDCSPIGLNQAVEDGSKLEMEVSNLHETSVNHPHSADGLLPEDTLPSAAPIDPANMTHLESEHERAFIEESMCLDQLDETKVVSVADSLQPSSEDEIFKVPTSLPPPASKASTKENTPPMNDSQVMDTSAVSDASDTSVITVIYNGQPIPSSRPLVSKQTVVSSNNEESSTQASDHKAPSQGEDRNTCETQIVEESASSIDSVDTTSSPPLRDDNCDGAPTSSEQPKCESTTLDQGQTLSDVESGTDAGKVHESVLNLQTVHAGKVASTVTKFTQSHAGSEDITQRQDAQLRFANSVTRRGTSPVRIPTIFAKADKEAAMYREITRNVMRGSVRTGVKAKPSLPISTSLVRSASVEKARRRLSNDTGKGTPETGDASSIAAEHAPQNTHAEGSCMSDTLAGHTPVRHPRGSNFQSVEINESLLQTIDDVCTPKSEKLAREAGVRLPLADSTNVDPAPVAEAAAPRIKQPMLVTDVGQRLLAKSLQYRLASANTNETPTRRGRPPVKSVKRLQGSPHSPISPAKSPKRYRPTGKPGQLSPIPRHVSDWNV